jgi:hypothetical protein
MMLRLKGQPAQAWLILTITSSLAILPTQNMQFVLLYLPFVTVKTVLDYINGVGVYC